MIIYSTYFGNGPSIVIDFEYPYRAYKSNDNGDTVDYKE